jgi:Skp family chaperone for outer membrane proteins
MFSFVAAIASLAILLLYRLSSSSDRQKEVTTDLKADAADREARLKADATDREARLAGF